MVITYYVEIDHDIPYSRQEFSDWIRVIVSNSKSWGAGKVFKETMNKRTAQILVRMTSPATIQRECNMSDLSCSILSDNVILINWERWKNGSKESGLSTEFYRVYIILHEFGHLLGYNHVPIGTCNPDGTANVMTQQTRGIGTCRPNPWSFS